MALPTVLLENKKIRLELETIASEAVFRPIGVIDEDTNFSIPLEGIRALHPRPQVTFVDLSQVRRINSCGVREWLLFMERLTVMTRVAFVQVNELMVEQANMMPGMLGKKAATIMSFYAPYYCAHCVKDIPVLLETHQIQLDGPADPVIPYPPCPNCGTQLEFDWLIDEYFGFLRHL